MVEKITTYRFSSLQETLFQLNNEDCMIVAGGTDAMVVHKSQRGVATNFHKPVVFIDHLDELKKVYRQNDAIHIGACCTHSELITNRLVPQALKEAMKEIAAPAIRNRGTIGGNVCNASPVGDTLPLLYIFNARLRLRSVHGERLVEIEEFIEGPRKIQRLPNEMVVEIILPNHKDMTHVVFEKVANRRADAIAKISFAGSYHIVANKLEDVRLAFGAVGPTILRCKEIEQKLRSRVVPLQQEVIETIISDFDEIMNPIDDQRSTASYRKTVALKLLRYFLESVESKKSVKRL